jgi:hypothetical protein
MKTPLIKALISYYQDDQIEGAEKWKSDAFEP